jgi:hypothetical protein
LAGKAVGKYDPEFSFLTEVSVDKSNTKPLLLISTKKSVGEYGPIFQITGKSPLLTKSLVNGLDLTVSATKITFPLALMSVLNSLSCHGFWMDHQNSNDAEIAPNVHWPKSGSFVHVDEKGALK